MRTRSGQELIDDSYDRADTDGASERHPRSRVLRDVNQGGAELWDLIIKARGRSFCRSPVPWTITTTDNTLVYTLGYPADFYQLIGVRLSGDYAEGLDPLQPYEEPYYGDSVTTSTVPSHYDMHPEGLALYPRHQAGLTLVVDYVPRWTDLTDSMDSTVDGVNGWEEYIVCYAARCMARRDDERQAAADLTSDMKDLATRIAQLGPQRGKQGARRVRG